MDFDGTIISGGFEKGGGELATTTPNPPPLIVISIFIKGSDFEYVISVYVSSFRVYDMIWHVVLGIMISCHKMFENL